VCGRNIFGAQMNHEHTQTHETHHSLDLGEATTFPLIVFFVLGHRAYTQMSFFPRTPKLGIPKFPKWRLLWLWRPITFCADLWLKWGLKQSFNPHWEHSNNMWDATCTQVNQGDSWLLVVGSQIGNLTPDALSTSFIDSNAGLRWKQWKNKELGHAP
jgi:hypothetical protein